MDDDRLIDEIDMLHWRIDQVQRMLFDLASRLGQYDMAEDIQRFHNTEISPAIKKMRGY